MRTQRWNRFKRPHMSQVIISDERKLPLYAMLYKLLCHIPSQSHSWLCPSSEICWQVMRSSPELLWSRASLPAHSSQLTRSWHQCSRWSCFDATLDRPASSCTHPDRYNILLFSRNLNLLLIVIIVVKVYLFYHNKLYVNWTVLVVPVTFISR